jgi:Penicillin tolerance protein
LYNLAKERCKRTFYIERYEELEQIEIYPSDVIGIVTGSSTPIVELERVVNYLKKFIIYDRCWENLNARRILRWKSRVLKS